MKHHSKLWILAPLAAMALSVTACADSSPAETSTPDSWPDDQGDITELVEAAKAEGKVTWFTAQPEAISRATVEAFQERFGIEVEYIALNSVILLQRYQSEAESGAISADLITLATSTNFFQDAIERGWGQPLANADLPVLETGEFPSKYLQGDDTASVGFVPFLMFYNEDRLDDGLVPETVEDLADPKYQDQLILTDPSSADSLVQFYDLMHQEYGEEWFEGVLANNPKFYPTVSNSAQAMAAGEGTITTPAAKAVAIPLIDSGAPVEVVTPPVTTGSEIQMMLTASDKAPHPNAAKLFANWLLSRSGNLASQGDVGASVFDDEALPAGFTSGRPVTPELKAEVLGLLGLG